MEEKSKHGKKHSHSHENTAIDRRSSQTSISSVKEKPVHITEQAPATTDKDQSETSPQGTPLNGSQASLRSRESASASPTPSLSSRATSAIEMPENTNTDSRSESRAVNHAETNGADGVSDNESLRSDGERMESQSTRPTTAYNRKQRADSPEERSSPQPRDASPVSVVYSDDGVDTPISEHHTKLTKRLNLEIEQLVQHKFSEINSTSNLQELSTHINEHMLHNERLLSEMSHGFETTRESLDVLNNTIIEKVKDEKLEKWLTEPLNNLDEFETAERKELRVKSGELREKLADVAKQLTEVTKLCCDLAIMTTDARTEAVESRKAAEEAARRAEIARQAAEEKARKEAESKRKTEEQKRRQEEEERVRLEKEAVRRKEQDQLKGTPEEQMRLDPNNWPIYIYKKEGETTDFDTGYDCIVRALPGLMDQDDLLVSRIKQLSSALELRQNDELVSRIIRVEPRQDETTSTNIALGSWEEPLSILIPHCAPRNPSRELVVLWKKDGSNEWTPLDAKEANLNTIKDAKLCECRPTGFGTFLVVYRIKTEHFTYTKKGGKLTSSVDSRVLLQSRPGAFRVITNFQLQVQPIDLASVTDVKSRFESCSELISSSPIIKLKFPNSTLNRPIAITVPIPASARPRPTTALPDREKKTTQRPTSAFGLGSYNADVAVVDEVEEQLHMLVLNSEGRWTVDPDQILTQNKKGDLVSLEVKHVPDRFWLLRTKADTPITKIELIAATVFDYLHKRIAQFIMRQKADDPTDICLVCTNSNRVDRALRRLDDDGYAEGTQISREIFMQEGESIRIAFRGNLQPDEDIDMMFPFNSHIKLNTNMYITEIDKFAQKGLNCYRGFVQFYTKARLLIKEECDSGMITREIYDENDKKKEKKPIDSETVMGEVMMSELLIGLPKPDAEPPKPLHKAPVTIKTAGPVDETVLRHLAADLGDEWKLLAAHLNVKKTRIQSIMRNHVNADNEQAILEMLLTWAKRIPRCMDKTDVLCEALIRIGRIDLAEEIRDKEMDFKYQRAQSMKDTKLRQIFVKVAQHPVAMTRWKEIGEYLSLSSTDILNIENEYTGMRERCLQVLHTWKDSNSGNVSVNNLARGLKSQRLFELASEIRSMNSY